jgi:hypothetical protein
MRILILCLLVVATVNAEMPPREQIQSLLHQLRWDPKFNASQLDDETRTHLIGELRSIEETQDIVERDIARRNLIKLGDRETAKQLVGDLLRGDDENQSAYGVLMGVRQAWVIPMLEPLLMRDEPVGQKYMQMGPKPPSVLAAVCMWRILARCPDVPDDVRKWAKTFEYKLELDPMRRQMRDWWEQNKAAFERQDYAAVKPLQPVPPERIPTPASPAPKQSNRELTKQPSAVPAAAVVRENNPSRWLVGILIVLAVLSGGLVLWRAKHRKS